MFKDVQLYSYNKSFDYKKMDKEDLSIGNLPKIWRFFKNSFYI